MSAWYLLWMFVDALGILVLLAVAPLVVHHAASYSAAERFLMKRESWWAFRKHHERDGLPCTSHTWAHGEMVVVPGVGPMCRRCGWARKALH